MAVRIFLSYRRDDSAAWAGRLRDALAARFGDRNIFQDVVAVRPGQDFTDAIDAALSRSDVILAVIGPRWLEAAGADGRPRLAEPNDYVRAELAAALAHGKQVIPVLVGGAAMPAAADLPEPLKELRRRQAVVLRDASWQQDVAALIRSLRGESPAPGRRRLLLGLGAAVPLVVVAVAVAVWQLLDDPGADGATGTEPASVTTAAKPCPTPGSGEWTDLHLAGSGDVGGPDPSWHFNVDAGHMRREPGGDWYVVLRTEAENRTDASQWHYPRFYSVSVDGERFQYDCFDVVGGENPLGPGATSEALVGFDVTVDPSSGFALDLDTIGEFGRIELTPSAAG